MDQDKGLKGKEYLEKLISLNRVAKVVKGGRRFSFSALVVVGDRNGHVGYGFGKANDVSEAIRKGMEKAKRNMIEVPIKHSTLPHPYIGRFKCSSVVIKPAAPGTGVIAGGVVRAVLDACGVNDVLTKAMGSRNPINTVKAVFDGLEHLLDAKGIAKNRGKSLNEVWG